MELCCWTFHSSGINAILQSAITQRSEIFFLLYFLQLLERVSNLSCLQFHCRVIEGGCDAVSCRQDVHICDEAAATKVLQLSGHCNNSVTESLKLQRSKTRDRLRWRTVLLHFNLYLYIKVPLKKIKTITSRLHKKFTTKNELIGLLPQSSQMQFQHKLTLRIFSTFLLVNILLLINLFLEV